MTQLLDWRHRMRWSQLEAARQLDVAPSTYISWENERSRTDGSHLPAPRTAILAAAAREAGITGLPAMMLESCKTQLRQWRDRKRWSQLEAARRLDVSPSTYISWENERSRADGGHRLPPRTAILAAAALEAGIADLHQPVMIEGH